MYIIGGTASKTIAEDLSKILKIPLANIISKRFPDEEFYIRILDDVSKKHVIIVQTTYPDPNIIELFIIQNAVEEAKAKEITIIIPYFGYARQDIKFQNGEPVSAKAMAKLISLNADRVITVDPHKEHVLDFFSISSFSCSAVTEISKYLKGKKIDLIIAPDKGALNRVKIASNILECDFDYIEKTRINGEKIEIKPKELNVKNKNVAIIDDIISTGGTMAKSIQNLKKQGAKKVFVACTHGLFSGEATNKLISAGCKEIISTDSISSKYSKVKIAPCLVPFFK